MPSTFIKPTFAELDTTHLNEIIPGYRNIEKRVPQNEPEEFNDNCNNNENNFNNIDSSNLDDNLKCPHKTAENSHPCIRINKAFTDKVRECQKEMIELRSEFELQRIEIVKLKEENERLKKELAHAKWTEEISKQLLN